MTPDELTRLRELHEKASPAPWSYRILPVNLRTGDQDSCIVDAAGDEFATNVDEEFSRYDFDVMLEARNALPDLLDHIDRLTQDLKNAKAEGWEKAIDTAEPVLGKAEYDYLIVRNPYKENQS